VVRNRPTTDFVFNHLALAGLPVIYLGGVRMKPAAVAAFQREAFAKFPSISVINIADALEIVQQVVDQIALVIRFLSGFAILAGAIILAASVAGTRFRRIREVVILKTLGATRRQVVRIFAVEFITLGAVAGVMGAFLGTAFSAIVLKRLMDAHFHFDPRATLFAVLLTAILANVSGWLASVRILSQKPLEALRNE
jgi:putative ABC transport system permease protein